MKGFRVLCQLGVVLLCWLILGSSAHASTSQSIMRGATFPSCINVSPRPLSAPKVVGSYKLFQIPDSTGSYDIAYGPDGNLWFTPYYTPSTVWRLTPGGAFTPFSLPTHLSFSLNSADITVGPDGNLWFASNWNYLGQEMDGVARITPSGTITNFLFPLSSNYHTNDLTAGPDGNLWFTDSNDNKIVRLTLKGSPSFTAFSLPTANSWPENITTGSDGNLWFTEFDAKQIGRITPTGTVTEFSTGGVIPLDITAGPDGNLWFTEPYTKQIGRMTPTGTITQFVLNPSSEDPWGITAGSDGNLWFTEATPCGGARDAIGRITPSGTVTEYLVNGYSGPSNITKGPGGTLWFTESLVNQIGRISSQ